MFLPGSSFKRSFINKINNKGPRTDPWGTPLLTDKSSDEEPLTKEYYFLSAIYEDRK